MAKLTFRRMKNSLKTLTSAMVFIDAWGTWKEVLQKKTPRHKRRPGYPCSFTSRCSNGSNDSSNYRLSYMSDERVYFCCSIRVGVGDRSGSAASKGGQHIAASAGNAHSAAFRSLDASPSACQRRASSATASVSGSSVDSPVGRETRDGRWKRIERQSHQPSRERRRHQAQSRVVSI